MLSTRVRSLAIVMLLAVPAAADNVLVWLDAPLHTDADDTSPSVKLGQPDKRTANQVVPMHQLGVQGDFIEVEPTTGIECAWVRLVPPIGLKGLHLFVKRSDLAPVVAKPFAASFKDGTRISLQPGVSVQDGLVAFDNQLVPVDVKNLGTSYAPHAIAEPPSPGKHSVLLDEKTEVKLGDKTFQFGSWNSPSAENRGARVLFPIAVRCATAVVSAPKEAVQRDIQMAALTGVGDGGGTPAYKGPYTLTKGTALTSPTGTHVVATLAQDVAVPAPSNGKACGDFIISAPEPDGNAPFPNEASRPNRTLHLCATAATK